MTMNQLQARWQAHVSARSEYESQTPKVQSLGERIRASLARTQVQFCPRQAAKAA